MTDREMLELAAQAAGIGPLDFDYAEREGHGFYMGPRLPMPQGVVMAAMHEYWNPLTDDGDALRLAVRIGYPHMIGTWMGCYLEKGEYEQDPYAATRRSIVRAAAEIGKAKEG